MFKTAVGYLCCLLPYMAAFLFEEKDYVSIIPWQHTAMLASLFVVAFTSATCMASEAFTWNRHRVTCESVTSCTISSEAVSSDSGQKKTWYQGVFDVSIMKCLIVTTVFIGFRFWPDKDSKSSAEDVLHVPSARTLLFICSVFACIAVRSYTLLISPPDYDSQDLTALSEADSTGYSSSTSAPQPDSTEQSPTSYKGLFTTHVPAGIALMAFIYLQAPASKLLTAVHAKADHSRHFWIRKCSWIFNAWSMFPLRSTLWRYMTDEDPVVSYIFSSSLLTCILIFLTYLQNSEKLLLMQSIKPCLQTFGIPVFTIVVNKSNEILHWSRPMIYRLSQTLDHVNLKTKERLRLSQCIGLGALQLLCLIALPVFTTNWLSQTLHHEACTPASSFMPIPFGHIEYMVNESHSEWTSSFEGLDVSCAPFSDRVHKSTNTIFEYFSSTWDLVPSIPTKYAFVLDADVLKQEHLLHDGPSSEELSYDEIFSNDLSTYSFVMTVDSEVSSTPSEAPQVLCTISIAEPEFSIARTGIKKQSDTAILYGCLESTAHNGNERANILSECLECIWSEQHVARIAKEVLHDHSHGCQDSCLEVNIHKEEDSVLEYVQALINDTDNLSWSNVSVEQWRNSPKSIGKCFRFVWPRICLYAVIYVMLTGLILNGPISCSEFYNLWVPQNKKINFIYPSVVVPVPLEELKYIFGSPKTHWGFASLQYYLFRRDSVGARRGRSTLR